MEFLPVLVQTFPGHEEDLAVLTDAYVRVHYGELPYDRAELEDLRERWDRLRARRRAGDSIEHQDTAEEGLDHS
jgi:hypothetical protein